MPEERKLVTVLFADVTGSTALGEERDPEDVRALMGRYYEHARRVIHSHGGTLEKFVGDAVMAVFGLPHAHGDDAERAVSAGLALQRAVAEDPELPSVVLRIGINTGEVVTTSDPTADDFLVTGDAVNVAARLQQCATPGEILTSERTYAAAGAVFVFADGRKVEVKGKREPVRVFPVVGTREVRRAARPRMVGREDDLSMLSLLHRRTLRERCPQLVSIVAPAGTGKTRLLEEFLDRLDPAGVRIATSRCLPYGQTLTYWPLRGLMEDLLGGVDRQQVVVTFQEAGHTPEDAARLADLVLSALGIEGGTVTERESVFSAWRLLSEALAQKGPLIVVFEDLHWASDSLLDLVEQIMQPRTRAPLLLITVSRPELLDRRPTWGGGARRNFTTLVLEPLGEEQTAELVAQLGPDLREAVRRRIVERSGGNPFFVTELVRGLAERGIGAGDQGMDAVPDTVHAAVLARLDLLEPTERRVLQAAAVGGRLFRPAIVQAVLGDLGSRDLDAAIDDLLARNLIVPEEGGAFTFRHILIRDVAYATLSRGERVRMHSAVAAWLEDFAADRLDEFIELIAYHYREAVLLSRRSIVPVSLPFDPARVVRFLERAGELASRAGALVEARNHLQSAIAIAPAEEHMRLYEKLGDCVVWGDAAVSAYHEALRRWRDEEAAHPLVGARLLRKLLIVHMRWFPEQTAQPSSDDMVEMLAEAHRTAEAAGDEDELWRVRVAEVFWPPLLHARKGVRVSEKVGEGRATALAAVKHFEWRGDWPAYSEALDAYAASAEMVGEYDRMIEGAQRRLAIPHLPAVERADALLMVIRGHFHRGAYDRAIDLAREALAQIRPGDPVIPFAMPAGLAAWVAWIRGRWSEIEVFLALVEEARQQQPDHGGWVMGYWAALDLAVARGDRAATDRAVSSLTRMLDLDEEGDDRRTLYRTWLAATIEDDPGRLDLELVLKLYAGSELWLVATLIFLSEHGVRAPNAFLDHVTRLVAVGTHRGVTLAHCTKVTQALAAADAVQLASAIDGAEQHGLIPHAARMRIVLAQIANEPTPLEQARPVLERLDDRQFLRRLEEVEAALAG